MGRAAGNTPAQACQRAENEIYRQIATHLGGSVVVQSSFVESEVAGKDPLAVQKIAFEHLTRFNLEQDVKLSVDYGQSAGSWWCARTALFTSDQLARLEDEQQKKFEAALQQQKELAFIADIHHKHPVVAKIDKLNSYLSHRLSLSSVFDIKQLAADYLSQIRYSPVLSVETDGPGEVLLEIDMVDSQGCLDGLQITTLLPSGLQVKEFILQCDRLELAIPRPAHPGVYTLPLVLTYAGFTMGPIDLVLDVNGKDKLASGYFHPFVESVARVEGHGQPSIASARNRARRLLFNKTAHHSRQFGPMTEQIIHDDHSVIVKLRRNTL